MVAPKVRRVLAPNPSPMTGPGTNAYLIGDGEVAVIDPGPDLPEHVAAMARAVEESGGRIVALLVTHGHADHLPAAYRLRERTGAPIYAHPAVEGVDRALGDGDVVAFGETTLVARRTPGHAPDHLCFWDAVGRRLFAGDLVAGQGTVVLSTEPGALARYLESLDRVLALAPLTILPGHGDAIPDGASKLREYLRHRAMRSQQILDALRAGPATVDALVARMYVGTPAGLLPMAARNVRAHLDYLAGEGRVLASDEAWQLGGFQI